MKHRITWRTRKNLYLVGKVFDDGFGFMVIHLPGNKKVKPIIFKIRAGA